MTKKKPLYISVDIETNGPMPSIYSMIELGAVVVEPGLMRTFHSTLHPLLGAIYDPQALAVTGRTHEDTLLFPWPGEVIRSFRTWLQSLGNENLVFVSDNSVFDGAFVFYYLHAFADTQLTDETLRLINPFGFSGLSLTSLYKGMQRDLFASFKALRKAPLTHNALEDAISNAEVMMKIIDVAPQRDA